MAIPTPQQTIISTGTDPALAAYGNALQTAAYISNGNVTYNITQIEEIVQNNTLTNNFNNTAGGASGQVQFNNNGVLTGDAGFIYNPNNDTVVVSGNVLTGSLSATANITSTANVNANIVNATNLRTDNLQYANGDSYVFTAVTGNITFDEENIISTGNMYLQPSDANISSVDVYLTGSNDVHMAASQSGDSLYLGNDSTFTRLNSAGGVDIQTYDAGEDASYMWNFGTNGDLTIPGSILTNLALSVESNISGNNSGMFAQGGGGAIIYASTDTTIRANNNGTLKDWVFNSDGTVALPGNQLNVGNASIDITSSAYSELLYINNDIANTPAGNITASYTWVQGDVIGSGIETKDALDYVWLKSRDGTETFPAGITIENNYKQYFNVIVNTDTGSGINMQVNIQVTAAGEMQLISMANIGSGYEAGDSVYVLGTAINGHNELNDVYMTVDTVDENGSVLSINDLTIIDTYTRPFDGVRFAGGGVVSGTDANGNVTIQTYNSGDSQNYDYKFSNQGTLDASGGIAIQGSADNIDLYWYNDDLVKVIGDYNGTRVRAGTTSAQIFTELYGTSGAAWTFTSAGTLNQPGVISMQEDTRAYRTSVVTETGSGIGLEVIVFIDNAGTVTIDEISVGGQSYNVGDTLHINGNNIGGHNTANRINLIVDAVGIGGVIEGPGQLIIDSGTGPKVGLQFTNFAAVQTDSTSNGNLVIQSFNTDTNVFHYTTFDNTGTLNIPGDIVSDTNIEFLTQDNTGGSIDIYTDWSSGNGVEIYLIHDDRVEITTSSGDHSWSFDNTANLTIPGEIHFSNQNGHGGAGYAGMITFTNATDGATNTKKYVRMNSTGNLEIINNAYDDTIFSLSDSGNVTVSNQVIATTVKTTPVTIAELPDADVAGAGARAFVTDAEGSTTSFGDIVSSGTYSLPVFSDGTDWRLG